MMFPLNQIRRINRHIVAKVIETKFVIRTESDISFIGFPPFLRIWLMPVNTIDRNTMKLVNRAHPFGVTFSQVIIYSYEVYTAACKCIQKDRKRSNKRFSLTGTHLRNFSAMKYNTAYELYVVVQHIPLLQSSTSKPFVFINCFIA